MQYRIDPKKGNKLSILGYGCMRFPTIGGKINIGAAEKLILTAIEGGVNYFDTAYIYKGSEEAVGEIFAKNNLRKKVNLATKLPLFLIKEKSDFDKYFNRQLERLKTDYIDYYFMHMLSSPEEWNKLKSLGIEEWIAGKKEKGQILRLGFSFHGRHEDFISLLDMYPWDFCQIQYNYVNTNYQAGTAGLKKAAEKGLPVIIMAPLLGGKLVDNLPNEVQQIIKSAKVKRQPPEWGLRWIWNHPEVTTVLSGMSQMEQLTSNLKYAEEGIANSMTGEELNVINKMTEAFRRSLKIPCTGCNYCMPCPSGVNIPGSFSAYNSSYAMGYFKGFGQYLQSSGAVSKHPHYADDCNGCGKCEMHCPQNIQVRESLKLVKRRFHLPGFKWLMSRFG